MQKTVVKILVVLLLFVATISVMGCDESSSPSDTAYWFSSHSTEFKAYDEEKDNINEAGTYWYFTAKKSVDITFSVRINTGATSNAYLYVNDAKIDSKADTGIYSYVYDLSLKKGDNIKLHAFWTNSLMTTDTGFTIQLLAITQGGSQYLLKEFDNSVTM